MKGSVGLILTKSSVMRIFYTVWLVISTFYTITVFHSFETSSSTLRSFPRFFFSVFCGTWGGFIWEFCRLFLPLIVLSWHFWPSVFDLFKSAQNKRPKYKPEINSWNTSLISGQNKLLKYKPRSRYRIQISMFRPIRVDHTNCLQVTIKTHSLTHKHLRPHRFLIFSF